MKWIEFFFKRRFLYLNNFDFTFMCIAVLVNGFVLGYEGWAAITLFVLLGIISALISLIGEDKYEIELCKQRLSRRDEDI